MYWVDLQKKESQANHILSQDRHFKFTIPNTDISADDFIIKIPQNT